VSKFFKVTSEGILLYIKLSPNAKKTAVLGSLGECIKISVCSQPVDNKANEELIKFLAQEFNVARKEVDIKFGKTSKSKSVFIRGVKGLPADWDLGE